MPGVRHDLDLALEDDDEVVCRIALGEQDVSFRGRVFVSIRAQHRELGGVKHRGPPRLRRTTGRGLLGDKDWVPRWVHVSDWRSGDR